MHPLREIITVFTWFGTAALLCAHPAPQQTSGAADTTGLNAQYEEGVQLATQGRTKEAAPILKAARARAEAAKLPLWQAKIDRRMGRMYCDKGRDSLGLALMAQAAATYERAGATVEALRTEADRGWLEGRAGEQVRGIERLRDTQKRFLALGDSTGAAYCMNKEASLLINVGDLDKAIVLLQQAAGIAERHKDMNLGWILCDLSQALSSQGDQAGSLAAADRAIEELAAIDDQRGVSHALTLKAFALDELGRYEEALAAAQRSQTVFERNYSLADALFAEGLAYMGLNRPKEALESLDAARANAKENGNMALYLSLEEPISKAAAASGDHKQAYEKLRHYYDFMKNCGMLDASNDIARMEMEHEFATKHLTDSLDLAKREAVAMRDNELRISEAHNTRNLVIAAASIVLLVAIGLWLRLRYLRRSREAILQAQAQLVESEKRREAEEVRSRIARDMHDEIGSDLTKIGLLAAQSKGQANGAVTEIAAVAAQVRGSLHDIVWAVDPRYDSMRSLLSHAELYAQRMIADAGEHHDLRFELKGNDRPIDPARKRNIFLLLKEALNNAVKYAKAENVGVALEVSDTGFDLRVSDNGVGFDPQARSQEGNGLRNMKARAEALGAALEIISSPGRGCTVHASGPLA